MNRNVAGRILVALLIALTSLSAMSLKRGDQSAGDDEIRIGNLMPYTGPLSEFAAIGKAEAAYFEMINERGGINGRKVRFISHDDNSDPTVALDLTRGLVAPVAAAVLAVACTKYHPQPLSPEASAAAFGHRTLADTALATFLTTYDSTHSTAWDAQRLALTAWYFRPDLEVERRAWRTAQAAEVTAGMRPPIGVAGAVERADNSGPFEAPWTVTLGLVFRIETRMVGAVDVEHAQHLAVTDQRQHDFAIGRAVAGNVAREGMHILGQSRVLGFSVNTHREVLQPSTSICWGPVRLLQTMRRGFAPAGCQRARSAARALPPREGKPSARTVRPADCRARHRPAQGTSWFGERTRKLRDGLSALRRWCRRRRGRKSRRPFQGFPAPPLFGR